MAWKRRIETSLFIMRIIIHVLMYVVSYKIFWNWIGVAQFASQQVRFDTGKWLIMLYFLIYCLEHIVTVSL